MDAGSMVHWFLTEKCNLDCAYCFKPSYTNTAPHGRNERLAEILADSGVREVTLTGGEPTLVPELAKVLHILKQDSIYVSLHTNGVRLNKEKIKELAELIDDIALPIDSTKRDTQKLFRGQKFMTAYDNILQSAEAIQNRGIKLG